MLDILYPFARPFLFSLPADVAHELMLGTLARAPRLLGALAGERLPRNEALEREAFGVRLANPIGLAAGLDKDGVAIPFWERLGFGFIEVGTVTAHPQPGNPKPRLFRVVEDRALINRAGFNNGGSAALAKELGALRASGHWPEVPVGVNVGKSKVTPLEQATADYVTSVERVEGLADYLTVNVSSPNTPGLRELQESHFLEELLGSVVEAARGTPVLLKLAPDLSDEALTEAVELAVSSGARGVIATNTTIGRDGLTRDPEETGGMSGRPLWPLARRKIDVALHAAAERIPVIGVGGVDSPERALELLEAGCVAVQLYTAMIYEGPGLPKRLVRGLAEAAAGRLSPA